MTPNLAHVSKPGFEIEATRMISPEVFFSDVLDGWSPANDISVEHLDAMKAEVTADENKRVNYIATGKALESLGWNPERRFRFDRHTLENYTETGKIPHGLTLDIDFSFDFAEGFIGLVAAPFQLTGRAVLWGQANYLSGFKARKSEDLNRIRDAASQTLIEERIDALSQLFEDQRGRTSSLEAASYHSIDALASGQIPAGAVRDVSRVPTIYGFDLPGAGIMTGGDFFYVALKPVAMVSLGEAVSGEFNDHYIVTQATLKASGHPVDQHAANKKEGIPIVLANDKIRVTGSYGHYTGNEPIIRNDPMELRRRNARQIELPQARTYIDSALTENIIVGGVPMDGRFIADRFWLQGGLQVGYSAMPGKLNSSRIPDKMLH